MPDQVEAAVDQIELRYSITHPTATGLGGENIKSIQFRVDAVLLGQAADEIVVGSSVLRIDADNCIGAHQECSRIRTSTYGRFECADVGAPSQRAQDAALVGSERSQRIGL